MEPYAEGYTMTYSILAIPEDKRFIEEAHIASRISEDPYKHVGAVIVSPDYQYALCGANQKVLGSEHIDIKFLNKNLKNSIMRHAESTVLDNCLLDIQGWTMYITMFPCPQCASKIIQRGIKRIVVPPMNIKSSWFPKLELAELMLLKAGLEITISNNY